MSERSRVFITGSGMISPCGMSSLESWQQILQQRTALSVLSGEEFSTDPKALGGQIKSYHPEQLLPERKLIKAISKQDVLGIYAALQAVADSQILTYRDALQAHEREAFNERSAIYVGSPGSKYFQQYDFLPLLAKSKGDMQYFGRELFAEIHPMWLLKTLSNNVLAYTGIHLGFKGFNHNITNHAVSGMQAIIEAYHAISHLQADRAVVVAYDIGIEPQALYYYQKLGLISPRHLKPFDVDHDGTLLAEGAGALVLESEASAEARGAHILGEVIGGGSCSEAAGLFSMQASGQYLAEFMADILAKIRFKASDLGLLVAHGNGNPLSDRTEAAAIGAVFGGDVPVTAFKWALGHSLCASGVIDTILALFALREKIIPGVAPLAQLAPDCAALNLQAKSRTLSHHQNSALIINRGFGSMNAALVIQSHD